jgi:hypothetical protein
MPVGPRSWAVVRSRRAMAVAVQAGRCERTSAATPETRGAASDVPVSVT